MLKLYVPTPLKDVRVLPFLPGGGDMGNRLFQNIPQAAYAGIYELVPLAVADVYLLPHEYAVMAQFPAQLDAWLKEARDSGKPILMSAYQDDTRAPAVSDAYILRPSGFKSQLSPRDIVMPAYVEDVGAGRDRRLSPSNKPRVSFIGKAGFGGVSDWLRYMLKNYLLRRGPAREGLYFRRKTLAVLRRDPRVTLHAVVRKHFSAHKNTIELPPDEARRQYIESILASDFTLSPRGDGNYSLRFFETLSLGRIPIFIDTDAPLPLEDIIPYDDFIVRVPWEALDALPELVCAFFKDRSPEALAETAQKARMAFEQYLYMPQFLRTVFTSGRFNLEPEVSIVDKK